MHLFMRGDQRLQHRQSDLPFSCFHPTCTIIELLHFRDHYLHDALHRTNYVCQCQSGTVLRILLPRCRTLRKWYATLVDLSISVTPSRCLRRCPPRGQSPFSRLRLAVILLFAVGFVLLESVAQASVAARVTWTLTGGCAVSMPVGPCPTYVIMSLRPSCTSNC